MRSLTSESSESPGTDTWAGSQDPNKFFGIFPVKPERMPASAKVGGSAVMSVIIMLLLQSQTLRSHL